MEEMTNEETSDGVSPQDRGAAVDDPNDVDGLRSALAKERETAQANYASWQRAAADFQNFKRRVEEERSEVGRLANMALLYNLLPIIDDLERALSTVDKSLAGLTWVDGIWLIYRKFQQVLQSAGVTEIAAEGEAFDPKVHEAVSEAPGDEGKVVSVVQRGYQIGDRVVRPAMVVVGRGASKEQGTGNKEQGQEGDTQVDLTD
jgi:molecular chaperone GrpE